MAKKKAAKKTVKKANATIKSAKKDIKKAKKTETCMERKRVRCSRPNS